MPAALFLHLQRHEARLLGGEQLAHALLQLLALLGCIGIQHHALHGRIRQEQVSSGRKTPVRLPSDLRRAEA